MCRTYPLSPNIDNFIYIDNSCPELNKADNILNFEDEIFENYQEKYMNTHFEFEKLKIEEFEKILSIKGVDFYRFIGDEKSKYLDFHKLSIKLLENFKL